MSQLVSRGLFVGIDHYEGLPAAYQLPAAAGDAAKLSNYFSVANGDGTWHVLIDSRHSATWPSRLNILRDFTRFVRSIGAADCGVFYFAGHGFVSRDSTLALAPSDFREHQATDSSVSLCRLFEIVEAAGDPEARVLFILDCCREGACRGNGDRLPANVAVLYACQAGQVALEDGAGGFLANSLLESLATAGQAVDNDVQFAPRSASLIIRDAVRRIKNTGAVHGVEPEVLGTGLDTVTMMVAASRTPVVNELRPDCCLETCTGMHREDVFGKSLRSFVATYFGLSADHVESLVQYEDADGLFRLSIPNDSEIAESDAFVDLAIRQFDDLVRLHLSWSRAIEHAVFRQWSMREELDVFEMEQGAKYLYTWTEESRAGKVWLEYVTAQEGASVTKVSIECQSRDTGIVSLSFAMPRIVRMFNRLRSLS